MIAKRIFFKGHVQGVGFRYRCTRIAHGCEVSGYVRNLPDGSVEMLVQGPEQEVAQCLAEIQNTFSGHIRDCQVNPIPPNLRYQDFQITY